MRDRSASLPQDKPRSSRRESSDYRPAETDRAASSHSRPGAARRGLDSGSSSSERSHEHVEWPSAQEILATHRSRPNPPAPGRTPVKPRARNVTQTSPTSACAPNHWTLPLWLAWPPIAVLVLCVGVVGCTLSWSWGSDSYSAAIMTNRLILADTSAPSDAASRLGRAAARHLDGNQCTAPGPLGDLSRSLRTSEGRCRRPVIRDLLDRALQVSPINPTARLALAQLEPTASETTTSIRGLGVESRPTQPGLERPPVARRRERRKRP